MNKITEVTKRDIIDVFCNGFDLDSIFETQKGSYRYYGRLSEIDFLKKIYNLDSMPSDDSRFANAEADIWQHTICNNDWESNWVFTDDRFGLLGGNDDTFLAFICAVFHPENRIEKGYWNECLKIVKALLKADGCELYECDKISNRAVYSWRQISNIEAATGCSAPFSVRNDASIRSKKLKISIPKPTRRQILGTFTRYDEQLRLTDDTGWNYDSTRKNELIKDISIHYIPKAYNDVGRYIEVDNVDDFIMNTSPFCVFDAIELYRKFSDDRYAIEINNILSSMVLGYKLLDGKIDIDKNRTPKIALEVKELGLKELINQAESYIKSSDILGKQNAIEKLWDAFERLKTYYIDIDKKASSTKIVNDMANNNQNYIDMFDKEFKELTNIGNSYRIRHHEMTKTEIIDSRYYDYLFARCHALIDLALKYM